MFNGNFCSESNYLKDEKGVLIPGVKLKETDTGTVTDAYGKFSITGPGADAFVVSFIGYETREVPISGQSSIDVQLVVASNSLIEVAVLAYGSQSKWEIQALSNL
ncbi:MAG TPA: carboxypeptidase-like regulatory domain-containing protein [Mucilaginibacter sp.]|jgi:hypothetical protein